MKALVSASRNLVRSHFPQVPGGLMCMKEQTLKRKHGSRRQGWGGEGAIERLYLGPDWPVQHSVLKPSRLLLSPRG